MDKIVIILLIFILLIFCFIEYKKRQSTEHFQADYLSEFSKYIDGIKSPKDLKIGQKKAIEKKDKKYKSIKEMRKEKILVTGATNGIGYDIAKYVSKYNCPIYITGKKKEKVEKIGEELKKLNNNVHYSHSDLTKSKGIENLLKNVYKAIGVPTILLNCALVSKGSSYISTKSKEDWTKELDLNVKALILLSQNVAYKMYIYDKKGRIINFTTYRSKKSKLNYMTPDKIITESMIETFSNVFADEMFESKIAITTIRVDEDVNFKGTHNTLDMGMEDNILNKAFTNVFYSNPSKIMPIVDYAVKAPIKEITGKILSTDNFLNNKELMPIVAPNKLKNDADIYNKVIYTKTIPREREKDFTTLTKQNPFEVSPKVDKFLKKGAKNFNKFNTIGKYDMILDSVLAKKLSVKKEQIVFFKTEYDGIKRIFELFVSKGSEIITTHPAWSYLELCSVESKAVLDYTSLINTNNKTLEINYKYISLTPKTKIIYLESPDNTSGYCIRNDDKWKKFFKSIPDDVILIIDERYADFVYKSKELDGSANMIDPFKLLKKKENLIIFRSFNNFYSIENLELAYIVTSNKIADFIRKSQFINPIDKFTENLALTVINDSYYETTKKKIQSERLRMMKRLEKSNIKYYDSDCNFFLIESSSNRDVIMSQLEEDQIILYNSMEGHDNYWTLPVGTEETNDRVLQILLYDNLGKT